MLNWKDITSYSPGESKRQPRTWEARAGKFRLVITKTHVAFRGEWVMHIYPGLLDTHPMNLSGSLSESLVFPVAEVAFVKILTEALEEVRGKAPSA